MARLDLAAISVTFVVGGASSSLSNQSTVRELEQPKEKTTSMPQISRAVRTALMIAALAMAPAVMAQSGASTLDTARARMFLGDWTLTVEAGRGPQHRPLNIKDVDGKVAAELGGARGDPITISDITMPADDLILVQTDGTWRRGRGPDGLDAQERWPDRQADD